MTAYVKMYFKRNDPSEAFTLKLKAADIKISMDGKGRWVDNIFVERLWRSVKYKEVYLKAYGFDLVCVIQV